jgi:DNA mismatch endonuclease, patch repair protein
MADIVDRKTRSRMMSGIRGKNTSPELAVRRFLHSKGYRYRLHVAAIPGRPDIVLRRLKSVVFVHGCFWHRHAGCRFSYTPKSNIAFWQEKFASNVARDRLVRTQLRRAGWRAHVIWECEVDDRGLARLLKGLRKKA